MLSQRLDFIREFQEKYPTSHVGGSIGLMLHGVDLKRDLDKVDVDLTVQAPLFLDDQAHDLQISDVEESSCPEDFEYQFRKHPAGMSGPYFKVDINILKEKESDLISHDGFIYRVSKKEDILFYKLLYALKGIEKHKNDLITIINGPASYPYVAIQPADVIDDLPF